MKQVVEVRYNCIDSIDDMYRYNTVFLTGNVQRNFAVKPLDLHCSHKLRTSWLESAVESDVKVEVGRHWSPSILFEGISLQRHALPWLCPLMEGRSI